MNNKEKITVLTAAWGLFIFLEIILMAGGKFGMTSDKVGTWTNDLGTNVVIKNMLATLLKVAPVICGACIIIFAILIFIELLKRDEK